MSRNSKALFHFFLLDYRFSIIVFWSIFLASMIPFIILSVSMDIDIIVSMSIAIAFFSAISGFLMTKETFSFSIRLGATRHEYVWSGLLFSVFLAAFMSSFGQIIVQMGNFISKTAGLDFSLMQMGAFFNHNPTWFNHLLFDFILTLFLFVAGFFLSSVFHRFGIIGGLTSLTIFFILMVLPATRSFITDLLILSPENGVFPLNFLGIFSLITAMAIFIWVMLRMAPITPGVTR